MSSTTQLISLCCCGGCIAGVAAWFVCPAGPNYETCKTGFGIAGGLISVAALLVCILRTLGLMT